MRKLFFLFVALLATTALWAHSFEVDGIYYNYLDDNNVEVTLKGSDYYSSAYFGEVSIPETVTHNGTNYSVTSIGNYAFHYCRSLTSITIPNSVTSIGESAFYSCSSLTSITIPNSVTSIGERAFDGCSSLTKTDYTGDVASWCKIKFGGCYANPIYYSHNFYINGKEITELVIPDSVTSIGEWAFNGCSSLRYVTCLGTTPPQGSGHISKNIFIYIPDNTLSAYQQAWGNKYLFINNESSLTLHVETSGTLSDLIFAAGMRPVNIVKLTLTGNLDDADFTCMRETMTSLVDVDLSGLNYTYSVDFKNKKNLLRVILPANLGTIGWDAFYGCSSLTSITIPNSVTHIGKNAFYDCSSLTSVTIPNRVTSIGNYAFASCDNLTSVTIGNSVTSIGDYAFEYCRSLTSITIPNSVTSIGKYAFRSCDKLTSITCLGTTPPNASDLRANTSTCTLIVPQSAYNDYLRHTYWGSFLNINTGYLVTLQANNNQWGEVTGAGLYTQEATITATPNEGYNFLRWSDGNTDNPRTIQVTSDTTLIAEFAIEGGYLVTFVDWDGTVLSSVSVASGEAATAPADPTREGYTFIGWDKDFSAVTDHMTVTAQYQINRYRVRFFDDNTLLKTDSVEYQSAAIAPANPYHEGYTFTGWDQAFDSITSDLDVYAQYEMGEDRDMTIVFTNSEDNDNEILSQSITIKIPAAPEIAGFTFLYWQPVAEPITNVITIQAIYEADVPSSAPEVYINPANPAQKLLRNGQVYILQDGQTYTIQGQKL